MSPKARILLPLLAAALGGCLPAGDGLAGSSTEAGNASGKLSLAGGGPAAGVEVALVSRGFRSDTARVLSPGDLPGAYYRTLTGPDGRFAFDSVVPGDYRVLALSRGTGATADSVAIRPGRDTALLERVLKPLGGIRGVAKVMDSLSHGRVFVVCRATLLPALVADSAGIFRADSLPEGEYDLEPFCPSCRAPEKPFRVRVRAGRDTLLADTLKLLPDYFQSFPPAEAFTVRPADLPFAIGGKTHYGDRDSLRPDSAVWTWDGKPLAARLESEKDGKIEETQVLVDSAFFIGRTSGLLRLTLRYPDTTVSREWRLAFDPSAWAYAMRLVRAEAVAKLIGGEHAVWRFAIREALAPEPADVAFWGLAPGDSGRALPAGQVELRVEAKDESALAAGGEVTFILVPDTGSGGKVFRPRRDERLADHSAIRLFDGGRLGFRDSLEPHMLPEGLQLDRYRGPGLAQRYLIARNGKITESLKLPRKAAIGREVPPAEDSILLFYRRAPAGSGFAWSDPLRAAEKAWAVDVQGRAWSLDTAGALAQGLLPGETLAELRSLLMPMTGDPPARADDAPPPGVHPSAYAWYGRRGRLGDAGADPLLAPLADWLARAGLATVPAFALPDSLPFRYVSFRADSAGFRYAGDTLILERDPSAPDAYREYLSAGSPGRSSDSSVWSYALRIEGDSLIAGTEAGFTSALFGKIGKRTALFRLTGLAAVEPGLRFGLPALASAAGLAGIMEGERDVGNRVLSAPAVKLVPKPAAMGGREAGYLFTPEGGLERAWRFAADGALAEGWDRLRETLPAKEGIYDESAHHP